MTRLLFNRVIRPCIIHPVQFQLKYLRFNHKKMEGVTPGLEVLQAKLAEKQDDLTELDKQYSPSLWSIKHKPDEIVELHFAHVIKESAKSKEDVQCTLDVSYDDKPATKIDFFGDKILPKGAPIFVFVHGGFWVIGCRQNSSFFVKPFVDAGALCAVVGYDLVNDNVLVPDIVKEVKKAIDYICDYAINRKSSGVYICGHSAGAHLIMMALSSAPKNEKYSIIKCLIPVSGLYKLSPLLETSYAELAKISKEIVDHSSPMNAVSQLKINLNASTEIFVCAGKHESPAFIDQCKNYEELLKASHLKSEYLLMDEDHFSIIESLGEADSVLTEKILKHIGKD